MPLVNHSEEGVSPYSSDALPDMEALFRQAYPAYATTHILDELRATDYARLDEEGHVYLDYTGGSLYAASQVRQHMDLLTRHVYGNPHSHNPTSLATTALVDQARASVLEYFAASPDEYEVIFTPNASGALKLVGESYPFDPDALYVLSSDNHNSVNGIREFARRKGAQVVYVPVVQPEMRLDEDALAAALQLGKSEAHNLLAFPAQSNFTGVQHSLEWVARAQGAGWDVLLDAAAFVPSNRLDLRVVQPDFVSLSFYKMFGYPTGVGALIARKAALSKLRRPWFAGGTITIASVKGDGFFFVDGSAAFEDGTVNYLHIPAVEIGLRHINRIGIETIHERVRCLSAWLLENLLALRHTNGRPMVRVIGPQGTDRRGGTITCNLFDPNGLMLNDRRIEELAGEQRISLRTGCFCNPGAGEIAHSLTEQDMRAIFVAGKPLSFAELYAVMQEKGKGLSAIRVSVGLASTFRDVCRFVQFIAGFRDRTMDSLGPLTMQSHSHLSRPDTA